jgi:threonyl-tRNA synthetase
LSQINVKVNGSERTYPHGVTIQQVLAESYERPALNDVLAVKVNNVLTDLSQTLSADSSLEPITFAAPEGKSIFWHSTSHLMAYAVKTLFPDVKLAIGPAIESGFYYDFERATPFSEKELNRIGEKMRELANRKIPFVRSEMPREQALQMYRDQQEIYKAELVAALTDASVSFYQNDTFSDMCRGPHVPHTGYVRTSKLLSVAGAYWRGDEKNKMLQRIYGISFPTPAELEEHLTLLAEAEKRDHRKLGKELDLFSFHEEGPGFPFWHPRGMVLYNQVVDFLRRKLTAGGYGEVKTPIILHEELWHRSGHWDKYRENMYFTVIDERTCAVKPMNCPGGLLIYKSNLYSYRDLPLRMGELGLVHRHEKAGVLHGLFRVRQFTQDDAHIFCTPDQIEAEINGVIDFVFSVYKTFGFQDYQIELSTKPEKHIGSDEIWSRAENALETVLKGRGINFKHNPGDGAFYGPKIDFHIRDSLKRSWQCGTIQLDFSMPERFELEYVAADGSRQRPVMIHRAILGSVERFIGILIEHYAGDFPVWLAPVQTVVAPLSEKNLPYAQAVFARLKQAGLRAELDDRNEKINYKIREAETHKVPYMVIVGKREEEQGVVAVRKRKAGDQGARPLEQYIASIQDEINNKIIP